MSANAFDGHIEKLHVDESLLIGGSARPHIDPEKWRPLIMSFCRFFGVGGEVHPSRLAESDFMKFVSNGTGPRPADNNHLLHLPPPSNDAVYGAAAH